MDRHAFALYKLSFGDAAAEPLLKLPVETGNIATLPVGKTLRYMSRVRYPDNSGEIFAILKDNDNVNTLLRFEGKNDTHSNLILKDSEQKIVATDFDKAENITINPIYGYIYYNVGSKIYAYDPIGTKTTKLMLDVAPAEVTLLDFNSSNYYTYNASSKELENLVVGTFNANLGEKGGAVAFYRVPSAMATIIPVGSPYSGFGKIKSVVYVNGE